MLLGNSFSDINNLKYLNISDINIQDNGLKSICDNFQFIKNLSELNIECI